MLSVVSNLVSFVAVYTCLDAVVVDLDSDDAIPPRLKMAKTVDSMVLAEFIDLLGDPNWKGLQKLASKNMSIDWLHSTAYQRDIFKLTVYVSHPRQDVVDAIWLEEVVHSSWNHGTFMDSKALDYAGDNRIFLWNKARPPKGQEAFISPRDGASYMSKIEVFQDSSLDPGHVREKYRDILEEAGISANDASGPHPKASVLLATNTSVFGYHYPETPDAVRGLTGTCGMLFLDYPPLDSHSMGTKVMWIANGETFPPAFLPNAVMRRIMAKTMSSIMENLKKYLGNKLQARQ